MECDQNSGVIEKRIQIYVPQYWEKFVKCKNITWYLSYKDNINNKQETFRKVNIKSDHALKLLRHFPEALESFLLYSNN